MHKAIATAFILVCLASTAEAKKELNKGLGASTCELFGERYAARPTHTELFYFSWAQGWMSAMNAVLLGTVGEEAFTDLGAISAENQMTHLRTFCSKNPTEPYFVAVRDLYDHMRAAQGLPALLDSFAGQ